MDKHSGWSIDLRARFVPEQIEWHKDGKRLSNTGPLSKINVIQVTEYSVTLAFESVQPEHRGNYTCVASNAAGRTSVSDSMIIHGECATMEGTEHLHHPIIVPSILDDCCMNDDDDGHQGFGQDTRDCPR